MSHDVFISYSSKDKAVADAVCARLESQKIRCWIAPRDVLPGQSWASAIVSALAESRVFIMVFSEGSNQSQQVIREVGEAVENGIPIIPFRIEDVQPSEEMGYYIKSIHWLDAMSPPLERHLDTLAESVQALLAVGGGEPPEQVTPSVPESEPERKKTPLWAIAVLVIAALLLVSGIGALVLTRSGMPSSLPSPSDTPTQSTGSINTALETATPVPSETEEEAGTIPFGEWVPLTFEPTNELRWQISPDGSYTAVGPQDEDSFAWAEPVIEGDFMLKFYLGSKDPKTGINIIVYGDGNNFSYGSLFFTIDWNYVAIGKHTIYHQGENWFVTTWDDLDFTDRTYEITLEVIDSKASIFVDGQKVATTALPSEINQQGKIALSKYWEFQDVTISNFQLKLLEGKE